METINLTIKLPKEEVSYFEDWLRYHIEDVVSFSILPDTDNMYNNDVYFKNIVKSVKKANRIKDKYINDNNHKYL